MGLLRSRWLCSALSGELSPPTKSLSTRFVMVGECLWWLVPQDGCTTSSRMMFTSTSCSEPSPLVSLSSSLTSSTVTLSAIPDGYTPKEWEYYPHPITRFITRYLKVGYQELYEVSLHNTWECAKISEMKQLKAEVKRQMAIHGDYKGWYHRQDIARYARLRKQMVEDNIAVRGSNLNDD